MTAFGSRSLAKTRMHGKDVVSEGPFHELVKVIAEFQSNPQGMTQVFNELSELKRKLPAELINDPDGPHLDDGRWGTITPGANSARAA